MWVHGTTYHVTVADFTGIVTIRTSIAKGRIKPLKLYIVICAQRFVSVWMPWLIFSIPPVICPLLPHDPSKLFIKMLWIQMRFFKPNIYGFHPQSVLAGWSSKWHERSCFQKDCETGLTGSVYCRKKKGLFPLLGWSVFLLMTDCPDLHSSGLTRKPLPSLSGPLRAFQALYLSPHCTTGQCWTMSVVFQKFRKVPLTSCSLQD